MNTKNPLHNDVMSCVEPHSVASLEVRLGSSLAGELITEMWDRAKQLDDVDLWKTQDDKRSLYRLIKLVEAIIDDR